MLTESQKKASSKYFQKFDDIKVRVEAGKKDEYKKQAAARGMSLNAYIVSLLEKDKEKNQ